MLATYSLPRSNLSSAATTVVLNWSYLYFNSRFVAYASTLMPMLTGRRHVLLNFLRELQLAPWPRQLPLA